MSYHEQHQKFSEKTHTVAASASLYMYFVHIYHAVTTISKRAKKANSTQESRIGDEIKWIEACYFVTTAHNEYIQSHAIS